ncbi:MAG: RNA methyltransferase [Bacteroidota bacterium]
MISKSQIKLITSLQQKKYRVKTGLFVAEGPKIIQDLLVSGLKIHALYTLEEHFDLAETFRHRFSFSETIVQVSSAELQKISALKTANTMLAVFYQPKEKNVSEKGLLVALDTVRDPGNLGTIIRLCDWFGVSQLICANDTVDCFNPKVVQATMGSIARVSVVYLDLLDYIRTTRLPIYGAVMDGTNVYSSQLPKQALLVMGNEAKGISSEITTHIQHKITIPSFGTTHSAESLNVATATGILLSEFKRSTEK